MWSITTTASSEEPGSSKTPNAFASAKNPSRLLVIAPAAFGEVLKPLIEHKNKTAMPVHLATLEQLCSDFSGKDDPEKIKRAIAYGHEHLRVKYVMLVGDASLCPVRFRQVQQVPPDAYLDCTYNPSELYYANLYSRHAPGSAANDPLRIRHSRKFDTWDADGNGRFNEQHWKDDAVSYNPDQVDGCPDVAVGRIPAHTADQVRVYVDKVIRYETSSLAAAGRRFTFVADRAYGGSQPMCSNLAACALASFPKGRDVEQLFMNCCAEDEVAPPWSKGTFDKIDAAVGRSWWITYLGHAAPQCWAIWENGRTYDAKRVTALKNDKVLPIVFTIGCESGMFMSWAPRVKYRDQEKQSHDFVWHADSKTWEDQANGHKHKDRLVVPQPFAYDLPENRDLTFACPWLFNDGGAIAFCGESLVCENDKGYNLLNAMFQSYKAGGRTLGDLWRNGQRRYWLECRENENVFRHPRIYLGIMNLFGDPSLRLP
jgi:hypothetical protein